MGNTQMPMGRNANGTTDSSGNFSFGGLSAGDYSVVMPEWGGGAALVIENGDKIAAGSTGIQLRASKGVTISGTVEAEGATAKNGRVSATPKTGGRSRTVGINADGSFEVSGLAAGAVYNLVASVPERAQGRAGDVMAGSSGVRILCPVGVESTGSLQDENGNPAKGVRFFGNSPDGERFVSMTDDAGAFKVTGLSEGATYDVMAMPDGRTARNCGKLIGGKLGVTLKIQP
jgi:hypothetical protein